MSSHRPLRLLSGETQEPGHLLLPRRHQEQQRPRAAESHEGRDRVLLALDGGTSSTSTEESVSAGRLPGDQFLRVALLV